MGDVAQAAPLLLALTQPVHDRPTVTAASPTTESAPADPRPAVARASDIDARSLAYLQSARDRELARLAECSERGWDGPPWNATTYQVACSLIEIGNALGDVEAMHDLLLEHAPTDPGFTAADHEARWASALAKVGDAAREVPRPREVPDLFVGAEIVDRSSERPTPQVPGGSARPVWDITSQAVAFDELQDRLGAGALSNLFRRGDEVVSASRIGENGYIALTGRDDEHDGPAQVRPVTSRGVVNAIQTRLLIVKTVKDGKAGDGQAVVKQVRTLFPENVAALALGDLDTAPNLRPLAGVVHTPIVRPDGSVLDTPGYDAPTRLLYLPDPGAPVPPVPAHPSSDEVARSLATLAAPLADFPWVTTHDRANYLGLLLTPLLRALVRPPFKAFVIEGPNMGVGKSLLSKVATELHGGVQRVGIPDDDAELAKVLTAILDTTTGPVVVFDNVTGTFRSPRMAGLLTSPTYTERRLGTGQNISVVNDRVWVLTGNNASIGGDLTRRVMRVRIDPGVPNPHLRTGFAIADLLGWVREHRSNLLWSLLVLVRSWVAAGRPVEPAPSSDDYASWLQTVGGILRHAGVPGTFGSREISPDAVAGADDSEWADFLAAVHRERGSAPWTCREVLATVRSNGVLEPLPGLVIPFEVLPDELVHRLRPGDSPVLAAKSLGRWCRNREGRWAGGLCVRPAGKRDNVALWRVESVGGAS